MKYYANYKCGHVAPMPPRVKTDISAKNYERWAKGQGLCTDCLNGRKKEIGYVDTSQHIYAELEGSYKQVQWALSIRQDKLKEIDLAQSLPVVCEHNAEQHERLRLAYESLARCTDARTWIGVRALSVDELVDYHLGAAQ